MNSSWNLGLINNNKIYIHSFVHAISTPFNWPHYTHIEASVQFTVFSNSIYLCSFNPRDILAMIWFSIQFFCRDKCFLHCFKHHFHWKYFLRNQYIDLNIFFKYLNFFILSFFFQKKLYMSRGFNSISKFSKSYICRVDFIQLISYLKAPYIIFDSHA